MSNCSNHKKEVAGISDMKVLAEMIGDLHYESLLELMDALTSKINNDGYSDYGSGKTKIGLHLIDASFSLGKATDYFNKVWQISKPFMEPKK